MKTYFVDIVSEAVIPARSTVVLNEVKYGGEGPPDFVFQMVVLSLFEVQSRLEVGNPLFQLHDLPVLFLEGGAGCVGLLIIKYETGRIWLRVD